MQITVGKSLYKRRKPSIFNLILNVVIIIFFLVLIAELLFNFYFTSIYVMGESMLPTLNGAPNTVNNTVLAGGDYVFVNTRISPGYKDIVVVQTTDKAIIKRVVAFGGDTVKIDGGKLFIKKAGAIGFEEIDEPYISEESSSSFGEHVVAEGHMFLLGDNRENSKDSRVSEYGDFPMDSLIGVVPEWSLKYKSQITSFYTFFEFTLGLNKLGGKIYGD